jgi:proline racemase
MASHLQSSYWIETEDWHTAGEPFRIVENLPDGFLPASATVAQRRLDVLGSAAGHPLDELRQSLCHEPRGHPDMYGGFITPPDDSGAHFGVLFWHKDGFSTACGHGTIALGYWALAKRIVKTPDEDGTVDVVVDVPSGRVVASLAIRQGKPAHADFVNVLSYQLSRAVPVHVSSRNIDITVDLTFGGAVYASLDAARLDLEVVPGNVQKFIDLGREVKAALGTRAHYGAYDLYGVIFFAEDNGGNDNDGLVQQRNVTVFADGQIDRSPCGSGTAARVAILLAEGRLEAEKPSKLLHGSIIGSQFEADIVSTEVSPAGAFPACVPRVRGRANLVGRMSFFIDPTDSIYPGFLLR